jgi:hypothetical protein
MPLVALVTLALLLAACGAQGAPPALGKPVQVTLRGSGDAASLGQATLTPISGAHVVVYLHGSELPYVTQMPALLRQGGCYGKDVAPLSANAPTRGAMVATQRDATRGVDVARGVDPAWYVVVLQSAAPDAKVAYCGHPLSERRQYFDLYLPDRVNNGIGYGSALLEGIAITQVQLSLAAPIAGQPAQWSLHSGGCQGATLASGAITPGVSTASGIAFAQLDPQAWWLSVAASDANGQTVCVKTG